LTFVQLDFIPKQITYNTLTKPTVGREPRREEYLDLFDDAMGLGKKKQYSNIVEEGVFEMIGFIKGMSQL
jgi:hypothetical protein